MPSFGEKLKQEREKRKITLEQISISTKIGTRMLQALEENKFDHLPGGIFNKGFVRAYSRFVGLDEDQTVAEYLEASGDAPPPSAEIAISDDGLSENAAHEEAQKVSRLEAISDSPPRHLPWGLLAAVLLLIALALSLWSLRRGEHAKQSPPHAAASAPAQPLAPASGGLSSGAPIDHKTDHGRDRSEASPSTASSPNLGSSKAPAPVTASPKTSSTPPVSSALSAGNAPSGKLTSAAPETIPISNLQTPSKAPAAASGEFTVVVQLREDSWINITNDGKTVTSGLLTAGSQRIIRGRKEIVIRAGNAGAVDLQFNGKKLDAGGEYGEVKTVTFGPQGILPNAPAPPSNP